MIPVIPVTVPDVPFYSQFQDIESPEWQKKGCGIASLTMIIDYYESDAVSVNNLLKQAIDAGAYQLNAGWKHRDLVLLSQKYGLDGDNYDLLGSSQKTAFESFIGFLEDGPVIASVHYRFDPKSTIPHLVVIDGIDGDTIYYNDPASDRGKEEISVDDFLKGWKKRFIVVRPVEASEGDIAIATTLQAPKAKTPEILPEKEMTPDLEIAPAPEPSQVTVLAPTLTQASTVIPATAIVEKRISFTDILKGWVRRFILVVTPTQEKDATS